MNKIEDLGTVERKRQEFLRKYGLDDKSVNEFRAKINKVSEEESNRLGHELHKIIRKKNYNEEMQLAKVEELILSGANVNYVDENYGQKKRNTALLFCCRHNDRINTFALLARAGADINLANSFGTTCCMSSARNNSFEILQLLIALDADINARCVDGDNSIISAKRHNSKECFDLLVEAQAYLNNRNLKGQTIFDIEGDIDTDYLLFGNEEGFAKQYITNFTTPKDTALLIEEAEKQLQKFKKM